MATCIQDKGKASFIPSPWVSLTFAGSLMVLRIRYLSRCVPIINQVDTIE